VHVLLAIAVMPLWLSGLLLVVVPTLIILCGPVVVRRFVPVDVLIVNNEVAGFKFAVLGVVYAVLLGLAVVSVWEKFSDAEGAATREAASLVAMYRLSGGLEPTLQATLRPALSDYARSVIADDWPAMGQARSSRKTFEALNRLYATTLAPAASDSHDAILFNALLTQLNALTEARRDRLILASGIVPSVIWLVLVIGAVVTLTFTFFFALRNLRVQLLMTAMLSVVIFLALYVALEIDYPFAGPVSVAPEGMRLVLDDFGIPLQ
jgi:hypothetical protein